MAKIISIYFVNGFGVSLFDLFNGQKVITQCIIILVCLYAGKIFIEQVSHSGSVVVLRI